MTVFSELYGAYYNAVAGILRTAVTQPMNKSELRRTVNRYAFGESVLNIEPAIDEERWRVIHKDGSTPLKHPPTLPLTTLQKRWLKAIYSDPRIKLFTDEEIDFDVEPLFRPEDISVFDKYSDGDPYDDEAYIKNFRLILDAIKNKYPVGINSTNRKGEITYAVVQPEYLEYSEKDDKFRVICSGNKYGVTINLGRIVSCRKYTKPFEIASDKMREPKMQTVEFELTDRRNALERVLMHFAHFEKQAEKTGDDKYTVTVRYGKDDETEMVIRILSFGPMIKVTSPAHFVDLIRERLIAQKNCEKSCEK